MSEQDKDQRIEGLEQKVSHLSRMLVKSFGYVGADPDTFLQNARRTTEAICLFIHTRELGEPTKRMMLNDLGRALLNKKIIPDRIGILIGTIQTYGNYGAHAQEDLSESTQEWIAPCQTALASLTNWFFLEYLKGEIPGELTATVSELADGEPDRTGTRAQHKKSSMLWIMAGAVVVIAAVLAFVYPGFLVNPTQPTDTIITSDTGVTDASNETNAVTDMTESLNNDEPADADRHRLAILYFDNSSDDSNLDKLKKGLASMMISDLSKVKMLKVVERDRLEEILKEQEMSNSSNFDATTAAKIGKLLGAEHILTGSYFEMMGALRVDARIIDVETGAILKSEGVDGPSTDFFKLEKDLVIKILSGLNVDLADEESKAINTGHSTKLSYETSLLFSEALELKDNQEFAAASEMLKEVLKQSPDFEPARRALEKVQKSV